MSADKRMVLFRKQHQNTTLLKVAKEQSVSVILEHQNADLKKKLT
jgi:hypothetical protein